MRHDFVISAALLAALLFGLIVLYRYKKLSVTQASLLAIAVIVVVGGWLGYRTVILPEARLQTQIETAKQRLAQLPGYRILQRQEPALWRQLNAELVAQMRAGIAPEQATSNLRAMLGDLLNQRIGRAGDEAINRYIALSLEQMESLRAQDVQLCFRFLFPQVSGGVNLNEVLPASLVLRDLREIEQLLQDSAGPEQQVDLAAAHQNLNKVVQQLYATWGNDLQWLNAPADSHVNRQKMCDMTIDLYRSILALPPKQSVNVLRMMLSANAG